MAIDTSATPAYTDAELLALFRAALASVATGQAYTIGGRSLTRANIAEIRETIEWLEERANVDDAGGGGIVLVRYGERV